MACVNMLLRYRSLGCVVNILDANATAPAKFNYGQRMLRHHHMASGWCKPADEDGFVSTGGKRTDFEWNGSVRHTHTHTHRRERYAYIHTDNKHSEQIDRQIDGVVHLNT